MENTKRKLCSCMCYYYKEGNVEEHFIRRGFRLRCRFEYQDLKAVVMVLPLASAISVGYDIDGRQGNS